MTNEILYTVHWVKTVALDLLKLYILSFILLALFLPIIITFFFVFHVLPLSTVSSDHNFELTMIVIVYVCFSVASYVSPFFFTCWNWGKCSYPTFALYNSWGFGYELWPTSWGLCGTSSGLHFEVLFPSSRIEDQSYRWKVRLQVCKSCLKRLP